MRHALKLTSPKLTRIHNVLLSARGEKLSTFELATKTKLCAVSTYISHLRLAGVPVEVDHVTIDKETIYRYWIPASTAPVHAASESPAGMLEMPAASESARENLDAR